MNILGVVASSRPPFGSIFSGSNYLQNSFLDADSNAGSSTVETWNGTEICNSWRFFSPTFTNTLDYRSLAPKYFLTNEEPYSELNEFSPLQKRIVQMNGIGSTLIAFNSLNRTFPNVPMKQITNTISGTTDPSSDWTKYEMIQNVTVPAGTTSMSFGALIRVRTSDTLRPLNFGGVYAYSGTGTTWSIDHASVCGSSVPSLLGGSGSYTTYSESGGQNSLFMWAGLNLSFQNRWNSSLKLRKHSQDLATDYADWKQLNVTVALPRESPNTGVVGFAMYFAENHSYLNDDGTPSGSIWFYNPYVSFS